MKSFAAALPLLLTSLLALAAQPPEAIPASSLRPTVVTWPSGDPLPALPAAELPEGYSLSLAAAPPLVTHPIAGCFDDRGRLFLGDAVGVNWNKAQLEAHPPNRVLLLEDTNQDGFFDKSTIFADGMTFPQGAQWLQGSLYVASPPGIWKLTDTDGDGVADERVMIVSGFDYTGNAADVHGPFLHPNGRLYWCHGRKGYRVTGARGEILFKGASSGIWSANPDGTEVRWHSLLAGDNPVEVDFTPQGDIIGVQNIYYSQPRGDTIVHWLYGGVYERADQMKVIAGLPRTLETMPVIHNFGHVAVSGSCFWRSYPSPARTLQFMVTHFNTQRLVRMELTPKGSTYAARENEFLKLDNPDIHFTDVMEAPDGSLLVFDTGGWFRIGCPASLMAKPDILGAIYRVRRDGAPVSPPSPETWHAPYQAPSSSAAALLARLTLSDPQEQLRALSQLAESGPRDPAITARLLEMMSEPLDAPLEHALLFAARSAAAVPSAALLRSAASPLALRRMLACFLAPEEEELREALVIARDHLDSPDTALSRAALVFVLAHPEPDADSAPLLQEWLKAPSIPPSRLEAVRGYCAALLAQPGAQHLVSSMLRHDSPPVRRAAWEILAAQNSGLSHPDWLPPLTASLDEPDGPLPLLLDALKKLKTPQFDARLQEIAQDEQRPTALRLKALDAIHARKITPEIFALLRDTLSSSPSAASRIQAATMLASSALTPDQLSSLAPSFASAGPVELRELLRLVRALKDPALARPVATELARNPSLISQQESVYRTAFSSHPPELFETILLPALRAAEAALDSRKRLLTPLANEAAALGNPEAGRVLFESGKGTCSACHQIGKTGRPIGPDLSTIGAIRTERDLLESILFPSNTLSRDFETYLVETRDGQSHLGVIRSHTAEGLLLADAAGQERNVPHEEILSSTMLPVSLMPPGLDATMTGPELLDFVAFLRSLR